MSLARPLSSPFRPGAAAFRLALILCALAAIVAGHALNLAQPAGAVGPRVLFSHLYSVALAAGMLWLGAGLGRRILLLLRLDVAASLQTALFELGLGLGGLSTAVASCGFLGLLRSEVLLAVALGLALALRSDLVAVAAEAPVLFKGWRAERDRAWLDPRLRLALVLVEVSFGLLSLRALAPPTGYDGLMYHLTGPKEFLQLGRIAAIPDLQQANMPFAVQMLYLLALALGSDEAPAVLHLGLGAANATLAFWLGRRFFGEQVGWLAVAITCSSTVLTVYAALPNVDYGWALFDGLAFGAFLLWREERRLAWLAVAGIGVGLSLGSKYLGVVTGMAIGLGILLVLLRSEQRRLGDLARALVIFGAPALLVAAPWYLKNWLWLGSPVWPFLAPNAREGGLYFAKSMNLGRGPLDFLLLLPRMYVGPTIEYPMARPSPAFLLLPAYLFVRKLPAATALLALCAFHVAVWSQGVQTLRYLLPVFPAISVVIAYTLERAGASGLWHGLAGRLAYVLVLTSLALQAGATLITVVVEAPLAQLVGLESRDAFLARLLPNHDAVAYLNQHRGEVGRVLIIGDARSFYLEPPARRDLGLDDLKVLAEAPDAETARAQLQADGITHVLASEGDLAWMLPFDPEGRIRRWWYDFEANRQGYLEPLFSKEFTAVYRVRGTANEGSQP